MIIFLGLYAYLLPIIETAPTFAPYFFGISLSNFDIGGPIPPRLLEIFSKWLVEDSNALIKPLWEQKSAGTQILAKLISQGLWKLESLCLTGSDEEIYGKLHYGVLNFVLNVASFKSDEKISLISENQMCTALQKIGKLKSKIGPAELEEVLDRLGQIFQGAIATKSFLGSKAAVKIKFIEYGLPKHEFLEQIFGSVEYSNT